MNLRFFSVLIFFAFGGAAFGATVEALGEAEIKGGDIPSARAMAISRAKWSALEQSAEVRIKVDAVSNNAVLADEAVKTELSGVIKSFSVTDEGKDGNIYWVSVKADIVPDKAKETLESMARNASVIVMISGLTPDGSETWDNPFSEAVAAGLKEKGFEIFQDFASFGGEKLKKAQKAAAMGDYEAVRDLSFKAMAPSVIIGRIKAISKGNDIGYGKINFSIVSGELTWYLIGDKDGGKALLASGSLTGRGQGATFDDAVHNLYKNMAKKEAIKVVSQTAQRIFGENAKTVRVALKGEKGGRYFRELREDVKNTPFVLDVKEQGLDAVLANYADKTYYLALFLERNGKYRVVKMDENEIVLERK